MSSLHESALEAAADAIAELVPNESAELEANGQDRLARINEASAAVSAYLSALRVTTRDELDALPEDAVILDRFGDVSQRRGGLWCAYETAPVGDDFMQRCLPALVLRIPEAAS